LIINAAFHVCYTEAKKNNDKEKYYSYVAYTQIHINRLQHQCNQLIYWKQHNEYKKSFFIAITVAVISFVLSLISIGFTIHYGDKNTLKQPENTKHCGQKNTIHSDENLLNDNTFNF
jgi:hypothetical protein